MPSSAYRFSRSAPRRAVPLALAVFLLPGGGCTSESGTDDPGTPGEALSPELTSAFQVITAEGLMRDVRVLSADSMEGRAPASPGEARAVRYIEARYREMGLEPVNDSYQLPIELVGMTRRSGASFASLEGPSGALPLTPEVDFTYWSTAEEPVVELGDVPVVFVGHGVEAPEYGWDDYKQENLEGKILLFLNDDPRVEEDGEVLFGGPIRTYYGRWTYKFEQAQKHGAAGAIVVHTDESASYGFSVIGGEGGRQIWQRDYRLGFLAWMDSTHSAAVAAAMGTDIPGLFSMASSRDFRPVDTGFRLTARIETDFERVQAPNVAGMIRGSDPELAQEYVVFTSHHDHMGMNPDLPGEDKVFNGALDNALGVAAMMGVAEALVETQPRRSILFVSVTAEEGGLLGSGQFVESPPVPRAGMVANFNIDAPQPYGLTHDVAAIGLEMNTLGELFSEVVTDHGLRPEGDPNPEAGSFYRSDQLNFAKAGVPAIYLQAGRDYVDDLGFDPQAHRLEHYHQPSDSVSSHWDLRGLERDMRIFAEVALRVANSPELPRWRAGNEFESAWRALYQR
ncbi:MAG: M28 family peptidase [Gemmatimonadota bacterium]